MMISRNGIVNPETRDEVRDALSLGCFLTEDKLALPVDYFTRPMAPVPSQWLQRVPSPQTIRFPSDGHGPLVTHVSRVIASPSDPGIS